MVVVPVQKVLHAESTAPLGIRWVGSGTFAQVSNLLLLTMLSYESALS